MNSSAQETPIQYTATHITKMCIVMNNVYLYIKWHQTPRRVKYKNMYITNVFYMKQRNLNALSTHTTQYTYTRKSLQNLSTTVGTYSHSGFSKMPSVALQFGTKNVAFLQTVPINVISQKVYRCCTILSPSSASPTLQHPPPDNHHYFIISINF